MRSLPVLSTAELQIIQKLIHSLVHSNTVQCSVRLAKTKTKKFGCFQTYSLFALVDSHHKQK